MTSPEDRGLPAVERAVRDSSREMSRDAGFYAWTDFEGLARLPTFLPHHNTRRQALCSYLLDGFVFGYCDWQRLCTI